MVTAHARLVPQLAALGLLLASAGTALAQAFGSISSLPAPKPAATTTTLPVIAPEIGTTTATAGPPPAFSSGARPAAPPTASQPAAAGASAPPEAARPSAFSSVSSGPAASTPATGSGPSLPYAGSAGSSSFEMAERIVVEKTSRRLLLLRGGDVIAAYPVRLGLNPYGHKQREGDFRTPEGSYYLSRRNPRSEFFLSLEVSYPSPSDLARARAAGVRPGGLIMIHGQPNVPRKPAEYYARNDWTDGCIAVSNSDMVDIWLRTRVGTPIEIRP